MVQGVSGAYPDSDDANHGRVRVRHDWEEDAISRGKSEKPEIDISRKQWTGQVPHISMASSFGQNLSKIVLSEKLR